MVRYIIQMLFVAALRVIQIVGVAMLVGDHGLTCSLVVATPIRWLGLYVEKTAGYFTLPQFVCEWTHERLGK